MQNDVRLIDANALVCKIAGEYFSPRNPSSVLTEVGMEIANAAIDRALILIHNAPTIYAVPVVRCRECKYAEKTVWSSGEMYCRVWKMNPRPDGFCHMGVKMDAQDMDVPTKDGGAEG